MRIVKRFSRSPEVIVVRMLSCSLVLAFACPLLADDSSSPFAADPKHLWNRLHRALWVRTSASGTEFGAGRLDPLLWLDSHFLLDGDLHTNAIALLDEFINSRGERLVDDPTKRAILDRDLWEVFDWSVGSSGASMNSFAVSRSALQQRLATIIRRLALSKSQIARLPDNYHAAVASTQVAAEYDPAHPERPFLPRDLFDPHGPWLHLSLKDSGDPVAAQHLESFGARSSFSVAVRHPVSRDDGKKYFADLASFSEQWTSPRSNDAPEERVLNPKLPQLPAGTRFALIRRMLLPDAEGHVRATPIIESIQIRVQLDKPRPGRTPSQPVEQDVYEFVLNRERLFRDGGGLSARASDEQEIEFVQFRGLGHDPFLDTDPRKTTVLTTCAMCHRGRGIFSMNSITDRVRPGLTRLPELVNGGIDQQDRIAVLRKGERYDFGVLRGLLMRSDDAR